MFARRPRVETSNMSSFTRQQHLESYIQDPQLAPSTRRVSNGMLYFINERVTQDWEWNF